MVTFFVRILQKSDFVSQFVIGDTHRGFFVDLLVVSLAEVPPLSFVFGLFESRAVNAVMMFTFDQLQGLSDRLRDVVFKLIEDVCREGQCRIKSNVRIVDGLQRFIHFDLE